MRGLVVMVLVACSEPKQADPPPAPVAREEPRGPACSNLTKAELAEGRAAIVASEQKRDELLKAAGLATMPTVFLKTGMEPWRGRGRPSADDEEERAAAIARHASKVTGDVIEIDGKRGILVDRTTHPVAFVTRRGSEVVLAVPARVRAIECALPDEPQPCHAPWERVAHGIPAEMTIGGVHELPYEHVRWQVIGGQLAVCPP